MNEKLEAIRQACIKANPEIVVNKHAQLIKFDHSVEYFEQCRPIRLVDVLLAGVTGMEYAVSEDGHFLKLSGVTETGLNTYEGIGIYWNLRTDDLIKQSEECIGFLYDILK